MINKKLQKTFLIMSIATLTMVGCGKKNDLTTGIQQMTTQTESNITEETLPTGEDATLANDNTAEAANPTSEEFYMPLTDVYTMSGRGQMLCGTIKTGSVKVGDQIEVRANGYSQLGYVAEIEIYSELVNEAKAGDNVGLVMEKGFERPQITDDMVVATPSQGALDDAQAIVDANAAVLHPRKDKDDNEYKIELAHDNMIQTTCFTLTDFESITGKEFGTNHVAVQNIKHEDAIFAGFKANLTNTSDVAYNPCMTDQSAFTYMIDDSWIDMTDYAYTYVEKDGELVTDVTVNPGETIVLYILGEVDNERLSRGDRDYYIHWGMNENFADPKGANYSVLDYSFKIYNDVDKRRP